MRIITPFVLLLLATAVLPAAHAQAPTDTPIVEDQAGRYVINLREVEIRALSEQVSQITGRTLILDPQVRGQVTVISSEPLNETGVWELFQSVLRVNGYAALQTGSVWRIVAQDNARQGGAAIDQSGRADAGALVTRMIRLNNLPADSAQRVLSPMIASFGSLEAVGDPNAIIVTDYAENVRRIETLAAMLDRGQGGSFATITLRYASAAEIGELVERMAGADGETGTVGPRVAVDERSNTLIMRGEDQAIARIRNLVASLDQPGGATPVTRVFRLKHSDAETVAEIISGIVGGPQAANNPVSRSLADTEIGAGPTGSSQMSLADRMLGPSAAYPRTTPQTDPQTQQPLSAGSGTRMQGGSQAAGNGGSIPSGNVGAVAIQPSTDLNAIVVRGTPAAIAEIDALIQELDQRRPQVMIEAAIVEITGETAEQLGVQLGFGEGLPEGGFAATSFSAAGRSLRAILATLGEPAAVGLAEDGFTGVYSSDDGYGILLQALSNSTRANLLSTPSLTTLDNQPAEIVVGQNVPFRTGSFTTSGNSTNPFTTIQREDVGITMRVVPRVHQGDVIRLEVSQEVSSLVNAAVAGAADLITNRRSIRTTVLADNRETIVLGGLITDDRMSSDSEVPIAGDIPVIGRLFGTERESRSKRTLFVFLRPTILRDRADVSAAADARYDRIQRLDATDDQDRFLLLQETAPKLPLELDGIY